MLSRFPRYLLVAALLLLPGAQANAAPILTLFNTGVDNAGAPLAGLNGITDPHWDIIAGPGLGGPVDAETYFNVAYGADGPNSRWISVNENGSSASSGTYTFQTTFDLTGFDLSATSFTMSCGTDNALTSWSLNGVNQSGDCDHFNPFPLGGATISSGFLPGINTIQFLVQDFGQPMAFRAQFTSDTIETGTNTTTTDSTQTSGTVPEPGTALLFITGAAAARLFRRRRAQ